jgi:peptidoglycan-associated lipoprotein
MIHARRVIVAAILIASGVSACRKQKPPATEPQPTPTTTPTTSGPTCNAACQDSIRRADSIRNAAAEAARRENERRAAVEAARATLTATVLFDYDRSDIRDDARSALEAKVPILTANPGVRLRVEGHTDNRGSDEYNLALGQRRAVAVKRFLTDRGIDASRIEIASYGEERPSDSSESEDGFARNRRAEFVITAGGDNIVVSK